MNWDEQNAIFTSDNDWQRRMRDTILKPYYYEVRLAGQYEFIEHGDPRSVGGVDTIVRGKTIDEKIVRWPRAPDGTPRRDAYDAFALETMSCTTDGREWPGWMQTNKVDFLFYCFADAAQKRLDCYLINFPALQKWFYEQDHEQWPLWHSEQVNGTECRIVPINQVTAAVPYKLRNVGPTRAGFAGYDDEGRFVHYCHCGKWADGVGYGVDLRNNKFGTWFCDDHKPAEERVR